MVRRRALAVLSIVAFFAAVGLCQAASELPVYDVATATELFRAIGPNRVIRLTGTEYQLTECADLPEAKNPYVKWEATYEGPQLAVAGVSNLTIQGAGNAPAHLVIEPRVAFVIHFINARNVTVENVRAGHREPGGCQGGVLYFEASENVRVRQSILYGCGTEGVRLQEVKGFSCEETTITDCSYYIMTLLDSTDVTFARSHFTDNAEFDGIRIVRCGNVLFDGCEIRRNGGNTSRYLLNGLFCVFNSDGVKVKDSVIEDNTADYFLIGDKEMELVGTVVRENWFMMGVFKKENFGDEWELF